MSRPAAESVPAVRPPRAPRHARTYYKVVAIGGGGRFLSIYDGTTVYELDRVTSPQNGCWVCPDLLAVVEHAAMMPSRSALLQAPRAILQLAGWNAAGQAPRMPRGHAAGIKLLVQHVMPIGVLPYTAAAQPGVPPAEHAFLSGDIAMLSSSMRGRPQSAPAPRPPAMQMSAGAANRTFGAGAAQAVRLQAQTASLHEDIMMAEARLARLRAVNTVSVDTGADGAPRPQRDWVRRALARTAGGADDLGASLGSNASQPRVERAVG